MSEDKLLPCPFCGGEAEISQIPQGFGHPTVYRVGCCTIDCRGRYHIAQGEFKKQAALDKWNQRSNTEEADK